MSSTTQDLMLQRPSMKLGFACWDANFTDPRWAGDRAMATLETSVLVHLQSLLDSFE